jgi:hypothetical protein
VNNRPFTGCGTRPYEHAGKKVFLWVKLPKSMLEIGSVYLLAPIVKYWILTDMIKQQAIAKTSTCLLVGARLAAVIYTLENGRTAHVYAASTNREALSAIEKGTVGCGRGVVHKTADALFEIEASVTSEDPLQAERLSVREETYHFYRFAPCAAPSSTSTPLLFPLTPRSPFSTSATSPCAPATASL